MYKGYFLGESKAQSHHSYNFFGVFLPICPQEVLQDIPNGISISSQYFLDTNYNSTFMNVYNL